MYLSRIAPSRVLVVVNGVRATPTLETCDHKPPVVLPEAYGEPELPDAYLRIFLYGLFWSGSP
jgi:hypothetical protein